MTKEEIIAKYGEEEWERRRAYQREQYLKHREKRLAAQREYDRAHKEHNKIKMREYMRHYKKYGHMFAFCKDDEIEQIENYEEAAKNNFELWTVHHRRETDEGLSREELIALDQYYDRPASELIFLTRSEHIKLHNKYRKLHKTTLN